VMMMDGPRKSSSRGSRVWIADRRILSLGSRINQQSFEGVLLFAYWAEELEQQHRSIPTGPRPISLFIGSSSIYRQQCGRVHGPTHDSDRYGTV
jgi:hypothetical protein